MFDKKMLISGIVMTVVAVCLVILAILLYNPEGNAAIINTGWGIMMLSAVFGWLPIFTFRKKGKVEGRSYIHTTVLVDSGIYSIVRHPQYLAGILASIGILLISPHWAVAALSLVTSLLIYANTFDEERGCLEKFGGNYKAYMAAVPRLNFVLGIIRLIQRSIKPIN